MQSCQRAQTLPISTGISLWNYWNSDQSLRNPLQYGERGSRVERGCRRASASKLPRNDPGHTRQDTNLNTDTKAFSSYNLPPCLVLLYVVGGAAPITYLLPSTQPTLPASFLPQPPYDSGQVVCLWPAVRDQIRPSPPSAFAAWTQLCSILPLTCVHCRL
jgi:hypothetical protein